MQFEFMRHRLSASSVEPIQKIPFPNENTSDSSDDNESELTNISLDEEEEIEQSQEESSAADVLALIDRAIKLTESISAEIDRHDKLIKSQRCKLDKKLHQVNKKRHNMLNE